MATLLRARGYRHVRVFEASDRVGGKSRSVCPTDVIHELGTCYLSAVYEELVELADRLEVGRRVNVDSSKRVVLEDFGDREFRGVDQWISARLCAQQNLASPTLGRARLLAAVVRYHRLHRAIFGALRHEFPNEPDPRWLPALAGSFEDLLVAHDLRALIPLFTISQTTQGYGPLQRIPAYYGLVWNTPRFLWKVVQAFVDKQRPFTELFEAGYSHLWAELARQSDIEVCLGARLVGLERPAEGPHRLSFVGRDGLRYQVDADATFSSIPYARFADIVDAPTPTERELAAMTMRSRFRMTLVRSAERPLGDSPIVNFTGRLGPDMDGVCYGLRSSADCLHPESRELVGRNELIVAQYAWDWDASSPEHFDACLDRDLGAMGYREFERLEAIDWPYFPRFTAEGIRARAPWRVLAEQGRGQTWHIGGSVCFESIHALLNYNLLLRDRHLGQTPGVSLCDDGRAWPPPVHADAPDFEADAPAAHDLDESTSVAAFEALPMVDAATLRELPDLSGVSDALMDQLRARGRVWRIDAGEALLRQGATAGSLVFVLRGSLDIVDEGQRPGAPIWLRRVDAGCCIGELGLLGALGELGGDAGTRSAGAIAVTPVVFLELEHDTLDDTDNTARAELVALMRRVAARHFGFLRQRLEPLFGDLELDALAQLSRGLSRRYLAPGERLFEAGEAANGVWIIDEGRVQLDDADGGRETLGVGDVIGADSLLVASAQAHAATATRATWLLHLERALVEDLLRETPSLSLGLARNLAQRLRATSSVEGGRVEGAPPRVFTLIPHAGTDLRAFAEELAAALPEPARILDAHHLGPTLHTPTNAYEQRRLALELGADDSAGQTLTLLLANRRVDGWTRACVAAADELLVVADSAFDPEPDLVERALVAGHFPGRRQAERLVLVHAPGTTRAPGTRRWLAPRPEQPHHHVAWQRPADLRRLGRVLRRRTLGLALAGGAARCFFHLGLLQALDELGVEVDLFTGTSAGANVAAGAAGGRSVAENRAGIMRVMLDQNPMGRPTLPLVSLMDNRHIDAVAREVCENLCIEDMWRPFACVATNLSTARPQLITRGPVAKAMMATASVPLLTPPVVHEGQLLVDGCLVDNLPVEPLRRLGADRVLACEISGVPKLRFDASLSRFPTALEFLGDRLGARLRGRKPKRVPNLVNLALQCVASASALQYDRPGQGPDLRLDMPCRGFPVTDFRRHEEMEARGRAHALEHAEAILALASPGRSAPAAFRPTLQHTSVA